MPRSISAAVRWPCSARNAASSRCSTGGSARAWNRSASSAGGAACRAAVDAWSSRVGQRPQLQVHLGGDVVRQPAQHLVDGLRVEIGPRDPAGQPEREEAPRRHRHGARHDRRGPRRSIVDDVREPGVPVAGPTGSARRARSRSPRAATTLAGGGRTRQGQRDERGHPVAEQDPQHGPGERPGPRQRRAGGRQRRLGGEQLADDDRRPRLHDVEDGGHGPAADRVAQHRGDVDERPVARDPERRGARIGSTGLPVASPASDAPDHPERRQPHRGDRPGQALGQAER